jgi:hypothetical protein
MGYSAFSPSRHPARFVLGARSYCIYLAHSITLAECDTTSGHHHVHHEKGDEEAASTSSSGPDSALAQIISIAILEFGVVLHSVLVGLTLAVNENFIILFVVLIFHRESASVFFRLRYSLNLAETFEGLGIGSRLAFLEVDKKHNWVPIAAALLYGLTTPIGIAAGLGVRSTYNPGTATASIVSGTMDSISAGILIYTSLVEVRVSHSKIYVELLLICFWLFFIADGTRQGDAGRLQRETRLCSRFDDARCSVDGLAR